MVNSEEKRVKEWEGAKRQYSAGVCVLGPESEEHDPMIIFNTAARLACTLDEPFFAEYDALVGKTGTSDVCGCEKKANHLADRDRVARPSGTDDPHSRSRG